jgi:hypothetical protein
LYQGTTLVGPLKLGTIWALAPGLFSRLVLRIVSDNRFGYDAPQQGLKPNSLCSLFGPTKVVP